MKCVRTVRVLAVTAIILTGVFPGSARAQNTGAAGDGQTVEPSPDGTFRLGELVTVLGTAPNVPGIGGSMLSQDQLRTFEKLKLDQAVNLMPGVSSNLDSGGRRNE